MKYGRISENLDKKNSVKKVTVFYSCKKVTLETPQCYSKNGFCNFRVILK